VIAPEYQQELLAHHRRTRLPSCTSPPSRRPTAATHPAANTAGTRPCASLDEAADIAPLRPLPNYLEHDDLIRDEFPGISNSSTTIITSRETESSFRGSDFCRSLDLARGQLGASTV